ncbi:MAG: ribonuclease HII [Synergistaceae bacterium]|nr:ribonuclease HII [Synergistaceae bacterium]
MAAEKIVAGVDEAGRGPIAGPVLAAAAILSLPQITVLMAEGLDDSKKLSERERERLFSRMSELGVVWRAQAATHVRIDRTDILRATLWAMARAVRSLPVEPEVVIVDGTVCIPDVNIAREKQIAMPKADAKVPAVMAASVVAKTLRDRVMKNLGKLYPDYNFAGHKGYPTRAHRLALDVLGPSPVHRMSFGGYNKGGKARAEAKLWPS